MTENAQNKQTHKKNTKNSHSKNRVKTKQTPTTTTNQKTTKHTDPKLKKHIIISIIKPTFSWQHIDVQLLVKKVDLMLSEEIVWWQSLGSYQFSRDAAFV